MISTKPAPVSSWMLTVALLVRAIALSSSRPLEKRCKSAMSNRFTLDRE